jgi:hypothetical protein
LELSNFSLTYGAGTEKAFRAKFGEIESLVAKMRGVVGPEMENKTHVS